MVNDCWVGVGGDIDDFFVFDGVEFKWVVLVVGVFFYMNMGYDVVFDRCIFWES